MQLYLKILSGMANSVDLDQTAPLIWVCTVCICHFVNNFGVQNFRIIVAANFKGSDKPIYTSYNNSFHTAYLIIVQD